MLGSIGGWVVFHHLTVFACQQPAGFVGIASDDVRQHVGVHRPGDAHYKGCFRFLRYHNNFASRSSSSVSRSRVHRSSLRYFQPPSARMTTILLRSMLDATRSAAPQDGPAKMPSWSFNWRVRRTASPLATRIWGLRTVRNRKSE